MGSPPGRPAKRQRSNFAGPVPECVHINKRITAAQSVEVRFSHQHYYANRRMHIVEVPERNLKDCLARSWQIVKSNNIIKTV